MRSPRLRASLGCVSILTALSLGAGCMSLSPQLQPTDYEQLESLESREDREEAYIENSIYVQRDARGVRYTKGDDPNAPSRSWQSLDAVLQSDAISAAALPKRKARGARILTALTVVSGLATTAGFVASAREGLDLNDGLNGTGAILLTGGVLTLGFAIAAGIVYGKMRKEYESAVDVYNDSLGMRLGLYAPSGQYIPPRGVHVDEEGFVVLDTPEEKLYGPKKVEPEPEPEPEPAPEPDPEPTEGEAAEGEAAEANDAADDAAAEPEVQKPKAKPEALVLLPLR
jgi:hypothetical protein